MYREVKEAHITIDDELREKVLAQLMKCDNFQRDTTQVEDSPYTTIVHRDLWINNIMLLKGSK